MLVVFAKAVIRSWAKTRTLNTTRQVRVRHFWHSQAISHRFWVKTATAPLFFQMARETCTQDTVQWHTEMSELSRLWSDWCDSLLAKPYILNRQAFRYAQLALHIAIYKRACGKQILIGLYYTYHQATRCWFSSINHGQMWHPRSLQNTKLHRAKKCLGLIHTSSFLARVHFPCFSEMAYSPAPRAAFSAL